MTTTLTRNIEINLPIAVAPYCSPRLNALAIVKRPSQWTDEEISRVLGLIDEDLLRLGVDDVRHKYPHLIVASDAEH
jgi:hypothetical protein